MNTVWEVDEKPKAGWKEAVRDRLAAFLLVVTVGVIFLVVLAAGAIIPAISAYSESLLPGSAVLWQVVHFAVTLGASTLLFALLFKFLPDADVDWADVWKGAFLTAVLFAIGIVLIGLYLGRGTTTAYGAAGSVVAILLWMYFSAMIFFFGAEFTQVYANSRGHRVRPARGAKPVPGEEPSEQSTPSRPERGGAGAGRGA